MIVVRTFQFIQFITIMIILITVCFRKVCHKIHEPFYLLSIHFFLLVKNSKIVVCYFSLLYQSTYILLTIFVHALKFIFPNYVLGSLGKCRHCLNVFGCLVCFHISVFQNYLYDYSYYALFISAAQLTKNTYTKCNAPCEM